MTVCDDVGFPTLGEVMRFLYKSAGVLPEKYDSTPDFDTTQRRTLQKALDRLASEDGNLQDTLNEAHRQLAFLVAGYIQCAPIAFAIGETIADLLDIYGAVVREEGTYLPELQSLRWLVQERWAPAAAVAVASNVTRFGLRSLAQFFPDEPDWYLPDMQGKETIRPLAKVMRWIYRQYGVSQTRFHSGSGIQPEVSTMAGMKSEAEQLMRERDLENAQNWVRGTVIPSAATLAWTFEHGFALRPPADAEDGDSLEVDWGAKYVDGARMALFLTRWLSYVAKALEKQFGRGFLQEVCTVFGEALSIALDETAHLETWIVEQASRYRVSPQDLELRDHIVTAWKRELGMRVSEAGKRLQAHFQDKSLTEEAIQGLADTYGRLAVLPLAEALRRTRGHAIPDEFVDALGQGLELAADRSLGGERIDAYEAGLRDAGADKLLPWMVPWLRFQVCYRLEDNAGAWRWISLAFKVARYRAGARQHEIVNHYIEMAAKMDRRLELEKGIHWALYIGVRVRWLHDQNPADENIDGVMEIMRRARYPV